MWVCRVAQFQGGTRSPHSEIRPLTLLQDQPAAISPAQAPSSRSTQGRNPALPTLGCALINSLKGKPFVWKEMVQNEAAATLRKGLEPVSRAELGAAGLRPQCLGSREAFPLLWRSDFN